MKPVISIIVPIYNVEDYLPTCLDSILAQTYSDFELILVNDGSPDTCREICDVYAKHDNRIKVIHKENGGVSSARNRGLDVSRGDYIAFVDPDDTVEHNMYEELLENAMKHNAEIVICPIQTVNLVNNTTSKSAIWKNADCAISKKTIEDYLIPSILVNRNYSLISTVNKLYKKSLFDSNGVRFDENKHHGEDARLNFKLLTVVRNLVYIEQPLYNYYLRDRDSLTTVFREDLYDYILDNKRFLMELSSTYNLETHLGKIKSHFSNVTFNYIHDVVHRSTLTKDNKYRILSSILNDKEFNKDILTYTCPSIYYRLLKVICILKNKKLLYRLVKAKIGFKNYRKLWLDNTNN